MRLPLIGTVDLTPSGLFLVFAVLVAVGYVVWQIVESRRKGSGTNSEVGAAVKAGADDPQADSAEGQRAKGDDELHTP
ncbi:hypothetical protein [Demequina lutea]|uniref:Uncharacterized protein n=1 Tax=Demequina lutea TaxID=431489 RepID=A0A7Z0CKA7_9MICO|nr:hypothetical protein [Demequina lutea]NYI41672.1 hypothetical protein [Demequina lutea]